MFSRIFSRKRRKAQTLIFGELEANAVAGAAARCVHDETFGAQFGELEVLADGELVQRVSLVC